MASNVTEHYGLSQWESGDAFLREEFNEDFRKIDGGLDELSRRTNIIVGSYLGTSGRPQYIPLGVRPKLIMIFSAVYNNKGFDDQSNAALLSGGNHYAADNHWVRFTADGDGLEAMGNFCVTGREYRYIAFV